MFSATVVVDTDVLDALRETARQAPRAYQAFVNGTVRRAALQEVRARLAEYPGPVKHPFEFATAKSRRYYFWLRKGKGPYRRTGHLLESWTIEVQASVTDGFITAVNTASYAQWVIGDRQVPGHRNTGWYRASDELVETSVYINNMLIDGWYSISEPGKGVKLA